METENAKIHAEAAKKNAAIVTVDPSKIIDDDCKPVDLTSASKLRHWLRKTFGGREVEVKDNGNVVRFSIKGLDASLKRRGYAQRQVYADIDDLLANSVYAGYELGDAKHSGVDRQDIYYAVARIGNNLFGIRFKIDIGRHEKSGTYKDHKTIQIKDVETLYTKKPPSPYAGLSPTGTEDGQTMPILKIQEAMGTNIKINDSTPKVNSNRKKD